RLGPFATGSIAPCPSRARRPGVCVARDVSAPWDPDQEGAGARGDRRRGRGVRRPGPRRRRLLVAVDGSEGGAASQGLDGTGRDGPRLRDRAARRGRSDPARSPAA
ncbi:hypothetical protein LCGC14_1038500, partial [marine sediment metagenome]